MAAPLPLPVRLFCLPSATQLVLLYLLCPRIVLYSLFCLLYPELCLALDSHSISMNEFNIWQSWVKAWSLVECSLTNNWWIKSWCASLSICIALTPSPFPNSHAFFFTTSTWKRFTSNGCHLQVQIFGVFDLRQATSLECFWLVHTKFSSIQGILIIFCYSCYQSYFCLPTAPLECELFKDSSFFTPYLWLPSLAW